MPTIDQLVIEIENKAKGTSNGIESHAKALERLNDALNNVGNVKEYADAISKLANATGQIDKKSFSSFTGSLKRFAQSAQVADGRITELTNALANLANATKGMDASGLSSVADAVSKMGGMNSENVDRLATMIEQLQQKLDAANADGTKVKVDTADAENKVDNLNEKLNETPDEKAVIVETPDVQGPSTPDMQAPPTSAWQGFGQVLGNVASYLQMSIPGPIGAVVSGLSSIARVGIGAFTGVARGAGLAISVLGKVGSKAIQAGSAILSLPGRIGSALSAAITKFPVLGNAIQGIQSKLGSIGRLLTFMLLRKAFTALIQNAKQGLDNLAMYSDSIGSRFNQSMSMLSSDFSWAGNALATAFEPILNIAIPIIDALMTHLVAAMTVIARFFAALGGSATYTKAIKLNNNYAKSLGSSTGAANKNAKATRGTGKAAKKASEDLKSYTTSIDELNILEPDKSASTGSGGSGGGGGGGIGGGGIDVGSMFETVTLDSEAQNWAEMFRNAWENADFTEIGAIVGTKLRDSLNNINWTDIQKTCNKIAKSIATFINGFVGVDGLWESVGKTLAQGLNTLVYMLNTAVTTLNWKSIGAAVAKTIKSAFANFDWYAAALTLGNTIGGILDAITGFIQEIDWPKVPKAIFDTIIKVIKGFGDSGLVSAIAELLGSAVGAVVGMIGGIFGSIGSAIAEWWGSITDQLPSLTELNPIDWLYEAGKLVIEGLFKGIGDALSGIVGWINDNIFTPFIEGFKSIFGIHSPSTVMEEMGGYLIEGLLNGVSLAWDTVTEFFSGALEGLKAFFKDPIGTIKVTVEKGVDKAKKVWNTFKNSEAVKTLKSKVKAGFNKAKEKWDAFKNSDAVKSIKAKVEGAFSSAKEKWDAFKNSEVVKSVKGKIESTFTSAKTAFEKVKDSKAVKTITAVLTGAFNTAKTKYEEIKDKATKWVGNGGLSTAFNMASNAYNSLKDYARTFTGKGTTNSTFTTAKNVFSGITDYFKTFTGKGKTDSGFTTAKKVFSGIVDYAKTFTGKGKTDSTFTSNTKTFKSIVDYFKTFTGKGKTDSTFTSNKSTFNSVSNYSKMFTGKGELAKTFSDSKNTFNGVKDKSAKLTLKAEDKFSNTWKTFSGKDGKNKTAKLTLKAVLSGFTVNVKKILGWAQGAFFDKGRWRSVAFAAQGGMFNMGQLFVAREKGPELVGTIGGHTAVMNNNQIVGSVAQGVSIAVQRAFSNVATALYNAFSGMSLMVSMPYTNTGYSVNTGYNIDSILGNAVTAVTAGMLEQQVQQTANIKYAVKEAVAEVLDEIGMYRYQQNIDNVIRSIDDKEMVANISDRDIARANRTGSTKLGVQIIT